MLPRPLLLHGAFRIKAPKGFKGSKDLKGSKGFKDSKGPKAPNCPKPSRLLSTLAQQGTICPPHSVAIAAESCW